MKSVADGVEPVERVEREGDDWDERTVQGQAGLNFNIHFLRPLFEQS